MSRRSTRAQIEFREDQVAYSIKVHNMSIPDTARELRLPRDRVATIVRKLKAEGRI